MRTINVEPKWENLFDACIAQVKAVVPKQDMQFLIVEMLEYGKRLHMAQPVDVKAINAQVKKDLKAINDGERTEAELKIVD